MTAIGVYPIELKSYELDHRGEMPLWVVFRFLQEAAELNAVELGFDTETMLKQALTWMLVRLQLRVGEVPAGRTIIKAESWPSGVESRFAMRDFRLYQQGAAEPFAVATSAWLLIDINRKRPVTVANVLKGDHLLHRERMIADAFPNINPSGHPDFGTDFRIRRSDLDMNDHVNNTHYVEWLAEAVPETVWREWSVLELDIEYKRAVQFGETVHIDTYAIDEATYLHRMTGNGGSGDIVLARTVWKKR
ncbi:MAG: acyl-ACP thioesterase [Bacteroidetes bacterium]|nr:acyl-ACP thioesterase [Bacteroidota bacterium]